MTWALHLPGVFRPLRRVNLDLHKRCLFTQDFLGVSMFLARRETARKELPASEAAGRDVSPMLDNDIRNLFYAAEAKEDVLRAGESLKKFVEVSQPHNDPSLMRTKSRLLKDFFALCNSGGFLEPAKALWDDDQFMQKVGYINPDLRALSSEMPTITLCYLDLLYGKERYHDVLEQVESLQPRIAKVPLHFYTAYMMSCLKIGTKEALEKAEKVYNGPDKDYLKVFGTVAHPYGLLLLRHGDDAAGQALEVVSSLRKRSTLTTGLTVYIMSVLERPEEAVRLLEATLKHLARGDSPLAKNLPLVFSFEAIEKLTEAVKAKRDKALNTRLARVYDKLDRVAETTEQTIADLVCSDIGTTKSMKYRRQKNLTRMMQKHSDALVEEEEDRGESEAA